MSKKPSAASIRAAVPLTRGEFRPADPISACNVCGRPCDTLSVWREHDERDQLISGTRALVFLGVGVEHGECRADLEEHPRLYSEEAGNPGHFPNLCAPCGYRDGMTCTHPDLKANGGPGLRVMLSDPLRGAIVCGRHGRIQPVRHALECAGLLPRAPEESRRLPR